MHTHAHSRARSLTFPPDFLVGLYFLLAAQRCYMLSLLSRNFPVSHWGLAFLRRAAFVYLLSSCWMYSIPIARTFTFSPSSFPFAYSRNFAPAWRLPVLLLPLPLPLSFVSTITPFYLYSSATYLPYTVSAINSAEIIASALYTVRRVYSVERQHTHEHIIRIELTCINRILNWQTSGIVSIFIGTPSIHY